MIHKLNHEYINSNSHYLTLRNFTKQIDDKASYALYNQCVDLMNNTHDANTMSILEDALDCYYETAISDVRELIDIRDKHQRDVALIDNYLKEINLKYNKLPQPSKLVESLVYLVKFNYNLAIESNDSLSSIIELCKQTLTQLK